MEFQMRIQDFPDWGSKPGGWEGGEEDPTNIWHNFGKNYIKMKKIEPRGGPRPKFYYVDPPLISAGDYGMWCPFLSFLD